ncbi:MAG: winged helix-turn-helix transcriptional regulator [Gammaproteobacteria bacterium]|nr:winged helix-turn-helix transcriptional regulator [Gammaproteobacteria bacterium]
MEFGQFCPIAKATEILGEKWTILILREILMGSSRFNELQRGLSMISTAVLTKRLNALADYELIIKKKIQGQRGHEYLPTSSARELLPIFVDIGNWGMKWTRNNLTDNDFDVDFLMLYLQRSIQTEMLPGKETIIRFHFKELKQQPYWWILVQGNNIDVCTVDPGKEPDVYFTCTVKTLSDIWMGENTYRKAIRNGDLKVVGRSDLTKNITVWMSNCMFAKK